MTTPHLLIKNSNFCNQNLFQRVPKLLVWLKKILKNHNKGGSLRRGVGQGKCACTCVLWTHVTWAYLRILVLTTHKTSQRYLESPFLLSSHFGHNISQNLTITETEIKGGRSPNHCPTHTGNLSSTKIVAGRSPAKWQGYCPASGQWRSAVGPTVH